MTSDDWMGCHEIIMNQMRWEWMSWDDSGSNGTGLGVMIMKYFGRFYSEKLFSDTIDHQIYRYRFLHLMN